MNAVLLTTEELLICLHQRHLYRLFVELIYMKTVVFNVGSKQISKYIYDRIQKQNFEQSI